MADVIEVISYPVTVVEVVTQGPQGEPGTGLDTLTTKGDTLGHNGTSAVRVPVGSNGQVLTADSTATPGVKWATPASSAAWADITGKPTFTDLATANTTDEDVEITDSSRGVILRSAGGTRYRMTVSNSGLPIFTALVLFLLAQLAPAQVVGIGRSGPTVVTDTNAALTWSNAFAFTNGADATTRTNLFATGGVPSGAAVQGAAYVADGSGGSSFESRRTWLARQATNGPVVTNGTTTSSLVISNVPTGLYWLQGQMLSTATTSRNWVVVAPNQTFGPRNLLGWWDSGGAGGFFNNTTNMLANNDGAAGSRNISITGPLLFTNTGSVSFNVSVTGATNTAQVLSNSFLFLRKLD